MSKNPRKLTDSDWVGAPECESRGTDEDLLIRRRDEIEVLAEISDPDACYSYDELAVVRLPGEGYFLCQTSGCSCPSPSETWGVTGRFASVEEVVNAIKAGDYSGFTLDDWAVRGLLEDLE